MRRIDENDAQDLFELDSDPEVHKYLGKNPIKDMRQTRKIIKNIIQQYQEFGIGRLALIDKKSDEFLGWSGLKFELEPTNNHTEYYDLGYRLKQQYWGQGIATETSIASLKYGFDELRLEKICAAAEIENSASNAVLRKAGMNFIEPFFYKGIKCHWYELSSSEWLSKSN